MFWLPFIISGSLSLTDASALSNSQTIPIAFNLLASGHNEDKAVIIGLKTS